MYTRDYIKLFFASGLIFWFSYILSFNLYLSLLFFVVSFIIFIKIKKLINKRDIEVTTRLINEAQDKIDNENKKEND